MRGPKADGGQRRAVGDRREPADGVAPIGGGEPDRLPRRPALQYIIQGSPLRRWGEGREHRHRSGRGRRRLQPLQGVLIGKPPWRERVCRYDWHSRVTAYVKQKTT